MINLSGMEELVKTVSSNLKVLYPENKLKKCQGFKPGSILSFQLIYFTCSCIKTLGAKNDSLFISSNWSFNNDQL